MNFEHGRMTPVELRVTGRASKDLRPVEGEVLDVCGMDAVGEQMVQLRVLETALVVRRGQREEGDIAARELINR